MVYALCGLLPITHYQEPFTADGTMPINLTKREQEVITLLAQGKSNLEIANRLGITFETVKEHVKHLFRKCNVHRRQELAIWWLTKHSDPHKLLKEIYDALIEYQDYSAPMIFEAPRGWMARVENLLGKHSQMVMSNQ